MSILIILQTGFAKVISEAEVFHFLAKAIAAAIGILVTSVITFFIWIIKTAGKQVKTYVQTREKENAEFKNSLTAINNYFNQTDKVQILHTHSISTLEETAKELETKSEKHGRILAEHGVEIKNIKKEKNGD